jgi:hypothetical protein
MITKEYNKKMQVFVFIFIYSFTAFANQAQEADYVVSTIKNKEVEQTLLEMEGSPLNECKEEVKNKKFAGETNQEKLKNRNIAIQECVDKVLAKTPAENLQEIGKKLDLYNYDVVKKDSPGGIQNYLSKRFSNLVHGAEKPLSLKDKNYISQRDYFLIYKAQLDKGILMQVSAYCLENIRIKNEEKNDSFIQPECTGKIGDKWTGCVKEDPKTGRLVVHGKNFTNYSDLEEKNYDVKNVGTQDKYENKMQKDIDEFVKEEFKRGGEYLKAKYALCSNVVSSMCKMYECNQTIKNPGSDPECVNLGITKNLVSTATGLEETGDGSGKLACNLMTRLRSFRKAYEISNNMIEALNTVEGGASVDVRTVFKGQFQTTGDNIENLTNVSSSELTANPEVTEFEEAQALAKELQDKCLNAPDRDFCLQSLDENLEEKIADAEAEAEAKYKAKVKMLEGKDRDTLKEYLEKNNFNDLLSRFDELSDAELVDALDAKFKAEQLAMIEGMKQSFGSQKQKIMKKDASGDVQEGEIEEAAKTAADELRSRKARLSTLLMYNNIVTSFLDYGDERVNNQRVYQREVEKLQQNDDVRFSEYQDYFDALEGDHQGTSDGTSEAGIRFIDTILNGASSADDDDSNN